ncbi:catabolite repressor/activator [Vibrio sonorensis]|uniref:catabolite repressor/activator n=1 Tax=Vibrio sonorensis TaxID=1004316 RepID=UPI0008D9CEF3|nr:catabolite repressor/activator [Vibrio sonorensis]
MTLDEIARLSGVSKTTASYVINGKAEKYRISKKTQEKVEKVVREHNFQPDSAASALRAGNSRSFGLIIPDLENSSYARLAKLLEQHSRTQGYQILIGCSDDDASIEKNVAKALVSRRIEALFVASCLTDASDFYDEIMEKGTPVIAIDRPMDDEKFRCIISEDFESAYKLTESLLEQGYKRLGLIGALPELLISRERELGVRAAASKYGAEVTCYYGEHFNATEGQELFSRSQNDKVAPDAIVTTSFTLLEGVLDALSASKALEVNLGLATFGDNRLLDFLPFGVNSLPQQFEVIAKNAFDRAIEAKTSSYRAGVHLVPRILKTR